MIKILINSQDKIADIRLYSKLRLKLLTKYNDGGKMPFNPSGGGESRLRFILEKK